MECPSGEAPYLQITIATKSPEDWQERARQLGALATSYDHEESLFTLTFPAGNIDNTLRRLLDRFPRADVVEVGLRSTLRPRGYRRTFAPGLTIVSPGPEVVPKPGEIVLKSNLSFGSGYHPTTELSLRLLTQALKKGPVQRVFDLGTGSGVLALAARALGASTILAADIDFRACKEALKNVSLNQAQGEIWVVCGSLESARVQTFDLLLANLTIGVITALAPQFKDLLRPNGQAVLSGFTKAQVPEVMEALGAGKLLRTETLEGWAGLWVQF